MRQGRRTAGPGVQQGRRARGRAADLSLRGAFLICIRGSSRLLTSLNLIKLLQSNLEDERNL